MCQDLCHYDFATAPNLSQRRSEIACQFFWLTRRVTD